MLIKSRSAGGVGCSTQFQYRPFLPLNSPSIVPLNTNIYKMENTYKNTGVRQITLSNALKLIDSDECIYFDINYTYLSGDGNFQHKETINFGDALDDDPDLTIEKFIEQADNYGSFWLYVWSAEQDLKVCTRYQIVDDVTLKPL